MMVHTFQNFLFIQLKMKLSFLFELGAMGPVKFSDS